MGWTFCGTVTNLLTNFVMSSIHDVAAWHGWRRLVWGQTVLHDPQHLCGMLVLLSTPSRAEKQKEAAIILQDIIPVNLPLYRCSADDCFRGWQHFDTQHRREGGPFMCDDDHELLCSTEFICKPGYGTLMRRRMDHVRGGTRGDAVDRQRTGTCPHCDHAAV